MTLDEVLEKHVHKQEDGCWIWTSGLGGAGEYGTFTEYLGDGKTKQYPAHKYVYIQMVGPVEDGKHLHHTCEVHVCVNPEHLEKLTEKEHRARHKKEYCVNGHFQDAETEYIHPKTGMKHGCKKCRRETFLKWKATKKGGKP